MTSAAEPERSDEAVPPGRMRGPASIILLAVVGTGVVVRFVTRSPLWLDEALSVNLAALAVTDLPDALRHDGHPALYYVLLGRWIDVAGDGDSAVRALSGLFSVATVPFVWAAARLRFGPRVAVHAGVLAATSPFLIRYGSESRMYALVALTVAAGWWAIERARLRPTGPRLAVVAAVAAVGIHTHYWTIWLIGVTTLWLTVEWRRGPQASRPTAGRIATAVAAGGATFVFWLPVFLDQLAHTGTPWADRARPAEIAVETVEAIGGGMRFEPVLLGILLILAAALGAFVSRSDREHIVLGTRVPRVAIGLVFVSVVTMVAGGLATIGSGGGFEARHAAVVIPLLLALAARGTASLPPAGSMVALIVLALLGLAVAVDDARRDRTQGEEVAAAIDGDAAQSDIVVFCPDQLAPATLRYLDHDGPMVTFPSTADPRFVDWYDYHDRIAAEDGARFAGDLHDSSADAAIWLVMMTGYRGFDTRCETIASVLATDRDQQTLVVASTAFEPMFLHRFGPRG